MTTFHSFEKKQKPIPQIENEPNHHETMIENELPDRLSEQDINQVISQNKVAFDDCIALDPDFDRNIKVIFSIIFLSVADGYGILNKFWFKLAIP